MVICDICGCDMDALWQDNISNKPGVCICEVRGGDCRIYSIFTKNKLRTSLCKSKGNWS